MKVTSTLVNGGLAAVRLPLTVAERTLRRGPRAEEWPPALAFDSVGATVKQVVGSLTRDRALADQGRLTQARIAQLRRGEEMETLAEALETEADAAFEARLDADAEWRDELDARTAARKSQAEELARQETEQAAKALAEQASAAAEAEAKAIATKRERSARSKRAQAERRAIAKEKRALETTRQVERIDAELESAKAARRTAQ